MRQIAFALSLVGILSTYREATAQSFWYVPPGYEYGEYYGINLGNGVGYGYGAGIGAALPLNALTGSKTADVLPVQGACCDEAASPIANLVPIKPKPTAGLKAKQSGTKVQQPIPVTKTMKPKGPAHKTAKTAKTS